MRDLTVEPSKCKPPPAKRPELEVERGRESEEAIKTGWYGSLTADLNGDGWCDFAFKIPYPVNSQMESYWLEDMLILGGAKNWRAPLRGKKSWGDEMSGIDPRIWPLHQLDLTDTVILYSKKGAAPYVLGLKTGYEIGREMTGSGCWRYTDVYRWDDQVDTLKRVDDATRDAVLSYYYSTIVKPCESTKRGTGGGAQE